MIDVTVGAQLIDHVEFSFAERLLEETPRDGDVLVGGGGHEATSFLCGAATAGAGRSQSGTPECGAEAAQHGGFWSAVQRSLLD